MRPFGHRGGSAARSRHRQTAQARLGLVNAIYLRANWEVEFASEHFGEPTESRRFTHRRVRAERQLEQAGAIVFMGRVVDPSVR